MSGRIDTLCRKFVDKRTARDKAKAAFDKAEKEFKATQESVWDHLDDIGLTTFNIDLGPGYGNVQFQKRETIRGIVKDHDKATAALQALGLEDALLGKPKIHQAPLTEHVKDLLEQGEQLPEGIDFNPTRYVSMSRK